jgi:hypothetical protein
VSIVRTDSRDTNGVRRHSRARWRLAFAWIYVVGITVISIAFILSPIALIVRELADPAWRTGEIPAAVTRWHASLSERIAPWAERRVDNASAQQLGVEDISGTEWPLFSSVLYLWTTEALQAQWARDGSVGASPAQRAERAVAATARLVADPAHASWVRQHWGDAYLERKNLFYRMLLVSGLDSYERLTADTRYRALLTSQVDTLAAELDASPHGVLEDYPGQAYSVDVLLAYASLARANARLGHADAAWIARGLRAFSAGYVDARTGLPGYFVDADNGTTPDAARGVGLSMMLVFAHELWPDVAANWYARYTAQFWQERDGLAGFREFAAGDSPPIDWTLEVDAGPVIAGFGTAASAFGLGATRARGDLDRAYPLAAQALVAAWPLPNGTLLGPRVLSNAIDAPYTGESALLFAMSRTSAMPTARTTVGTPAAVWWALTILFVIGVAQPAWAIRRLLRIRRAVAHT